MERLKVIGWIALLIILGQGARGQSALTVAIIAGIQLGIMAKLFLDWRRRRKNM